MMMMVVVGMRKVVMVVAVAEASDLVRLSRLPSVDLAQQVLLSFLEELVRELPPVRIHFPKSLLIIQTQNTN